MDSIREVLSSAIQSGGAISDFRQAGGSEGYFQNLLYVYAGKEESCHYCEFSIQSQVIAGRNSFLCPACERQSIIKSSAKRIKGAQSSRKATPRTRRS